MTHHRNFGLSNQTVRLALVEQPAARHRADTLREIYPELGGRGGVAFPAGRVPLGPRNEDAHYPNHPPTIVVAVAVAGSVCLLLIAIMWRVLT